MILNTMMGHLLQHMILNFLEKDSDPNTAASYAYLLYPIKNAQQVNEGKVSLDEVGVKAIDDKTLKVELNSPTAYFKSLLILPHICQ